MDQARFLAIALRLQAEKEFNVSGRHDAEIIANWPEDLWKTALERAANLTEMPPRLRRTETKRTSEVTYQLTLLNRTGVNFMVNEMRDNQHALAMALAAMMVDQQGKTLEDEDAKVVERLPEGMWEEAQKIASQPGLPQNLKGVKFVAADHEKKTLHRQNKNDKYKGEIFRKGKKIALGSFTIREDSNLLPENKRSHHKAKSLAIAVCLEKERESK